MIAPSSCEAAAAMDHALGSADDPNGEASAEAPTGVDWHAAPVVRAVRANWEAMSVVHFVLLFRELIGLQPAHTLDCLPERAVGFGLRFDESLDGKDSCPTRLGEGAGAVVDCESPYGRRFRGSLDDSEEDGSSQEIEEWTHSQAQHRNDIASPTDDDDERLTELFGALVKFLARESSDKKATERLSRNLLGDKCLVDRARRLKYLCEDAAERSAIRDLVGGTGKMPIASAVRLVSGSKDAAGKKYVWIRGFEGCPSGRIEVTSAVQSDAVPTARVVEGPAVEELAAGLEAGPAARADRFSCAWLREKLRRSDTRTAKIELEVQAKVIHISGQIVNVDTCGRGKRARKEVLYAEFENSNDVFEQVDSSGEGSENESDDGGSDPEFRDKTSLKRRRRAEEEDEAFEVNAHELDGSDSDVVEEEEMLAEDNSSTQFSQESPASHRVQPAARVIDSRRARDVEKLSDLPRIPRLGRRVDAPEAPAHRLPRSSSRTERALRSLGSVKKETRGRVTRQTRRQADHSEDSGSDFLLD